MGAEGGGPNGSKVFVYLLAMDGEGWNRASLRRQHSLNKDRKMPSRCISKEQCDRQWEQHVRRANTMILKDQESATLL